MKYIVNEQVVLSQPLEGPLKAHIALFAQWAGEQGYALSYVHRKVLIAGCFSRWLGQKRVRLRDVSSEHVAQYLRCRARRVRPHQGDAAALRQLIDFLRRRGVIRAQRIVPRRLTPVERCAQAFERFLREERGLASATVTNYVPFIRCFLQNRFGRERVLLSSLSGGDVVKFVQRQAPRLHLKRAKLLTTALRSFLRYARYRGNITLDLAAAVPTVANWSMTTIPRAIAANQVRRLLAGIDRRTAPGRRDYAILLLLARLGLRASEVAFLELDDIDWKSGRLLVSGKGGQRTELPLPTDVGEAIVEYLQRGRPRSTSRRVFLRCKAPVRGFATAQAIGSIVQHAIERTGIDAPSKGTHQFRHALATEMLRCGASLSEIGELLGHRSPETTKIYAKVDLIALRTLALPWPGGVR
jgi:site-specific recombinase XerD